MTRKYTEITVVGDDDTGLVSRITTLLFERGINIEDIDQAVRDGLFRMSMDVDTASMECDRAELREALQDLGYDLDLDITVRFPSDRDPSQIAVLCTSESHCLEAMLEAEASDELGDAEISVVISNRGELRSVASRYDLPYYDIGDGNGAPDENRLLDLLDEFAVDLVVLARYMRILSPEVVFRYEDRIINVHPSLLPAFPGAEAYRQAIEAGVRVTGATAHYVTTDLDQGPIITQRAINVPPDATTEGLRERGQPVEATALLSAVRLHLENATSVHQGTVAIRDGVDEQVGLPPEVSDLTPDAPVDGERLPVGPSSAATD